MSLLTVVQNAMVLTGLPTPTEAFSSTNDTVQQFVRLVYVSGRALMKRYDWQKLLVTQTLTCAATNAQTGYPVAAFDRMARGTDVWNTSSDWKILGPVNSQEWNDLIVRGVTALPQYWRIIGGVLNIYAPSSGDTIQYEYISKNWILDGGVTATATLTGDDDTFVYDENLMELDLVWRFKKAKQLDYAEDLKDFEIAFAVATTSDVGGRRVIGTDLPEDHRPHRTWPGTVTAV